MDTFGQPLFDSQSLGLSAAPTLNQSDILSDPSKATTHLQVVLFGYQIPQASVCVSGVHELARASDTKFPRNPTGSINTVLHL